MMAMKVAFSIYSNVQNGLSVQQIRKFIRKLIKQRRGRLKICRWRMVRVECILIWLSYCRRCNPCSRLMEVT